MAATATDLPSTPKRHRPWGWIGISAVLVLATVGLLIWAIGLNSDLNDQKAKTEEAQQAATAANAQVEELSTEVGTIKQSVADATAKLQQAGANAQANG